jgi:hypothetical protein
VDFGCARWLPAPEEYDLGMLDKLKKLFKRSSKEPSEGMAQKRADAKDRAEELTPGHSDRAAQIGMFGSQ